MTGFNEASLESDAPSSNLSPPLRALWWLKKGGFSLGPAWDQAHAICQEDEGNRDYDLVHAFVHWIEGDESNAAYWYRRVGGDRAATIEAEFVRIQKKLSA